MSKVLGLDLGTNSIGWAIIDTDNNQIESCGTRIFPGKAVRHKKNCKTKEKERIYNCQLASLHFICNSFIIIV